MTQESGFTWFVKCLIKSVAAGVCIGIGTTTYLTCPNKIVGAFIFSLGLLLVLTYSLDLFTGKVGYLINYYPKGLFLTLIGNAIGIIFMMSIATKANPNLVPVLQDIATTKLNTSAIQLIASGFICGMLMFLAVDMFKWGSNIMSVYSGIFLCVPTFILCGFDHCVVSAAYIPFGENMWGMIRFMLLVALGNSLGAMFINLLARQIHTIGVPNDKEKK